MSDLDMCPSLLGQLLTGGPKRFRREKSRSVAEALRVAGAVPAGESAGWELGRAELRLGPAVKRAWFAENQRKMALDTMSGSVADCLQ